MVACGFDTNFSHSLVDRRFSFPFHGSRVTDWLELSYRVAGQCRNSFLDVELSYIPMTPERGKCASCLFVICTAVSTISPCFAGIPRMIQPVGRREAEEQDIPEASTIPTRDMFDSYERDISAVNSWSQRQIDISNLILIFSNLFNFPNNILFIIFCHLYGLFLNFCRNFA